MVIEMIKQLVDEYARVLDRKEVEAWATLFAKSAEYHVISRENVNQNLPLAHVYDDSRDRIDDRVDYIRKVWKSHYNDYQTRHFLSCISILPTDGERFLVGSHVAIYVTELDGMSSLLAVGEYRDVVVIEDGLPRFREKKVILDTAVLPRGFVYPL